MSRIIPQLLFCGLLLATTPIDAQSICPGGSVPVNSGSAPGAYNCLCQDGSFASAYGCPDTEQVQLPQGNYIDHFDDPTMSVLKKLYQRIRGKTKPLQYESLSYNLKQDSIDFSPPPGYDDPYEDKRPTAKVEDPAVPPGYDPFTGQVELEKDQKVLKPSEGYVARGWDAISNWIGGLGKSGNCTFDSPSCKKDQ